MAQTGKSIDGVNFSGSKVSVTNKKKVAAETVTLKVKKTWDGQEKAGHPVTKFGLLKNGQLVESTVKTLTADQHELTWDNIKKSELESYNVYEVNENGKKAGKYITLAGNTYEIFPKDNSWKHEGGNVYSRAFDNSSITVITVDKEWKGKDGKALKDIPSKAIIYITATHEQGQSPRYNHYFDAKTNRNDYYVSSGFKKLSFQEENAALELGKQVEVAIDGRTFLATLSQVKENHYKVVNQEKPDKFAVTFKKLDEAGKALADAKFGLYKKADPVNPVKEFLTGTKDINLKLEAGEYVLRELSAPDGYVKVAEDIKFAVDDKGKVTQTGESIDGVEFKGNTVSVTNKKKVAAETVTLKVKKTWDGQEKAGHPVTKFGLFKAGKLLPDTVQTLNADQHELTWTGIKRVNFRYIRCMSLPKMTKKLKSTSL
ncbi:prealbumin-like fold domain-containing protein [Arcanobacterium hippocoleae]